MLNIIKNAFIMFYKYLPILIIIGLTYPLTTDLLKQNYPITTHIIAFLRVLIILTIFSGIKQLNYFKSWKFWISYTSIYIVIKIINYSASEFFLNIIMNKIISHFDTLYTMPCFLILHMATISCLGFYITIPLCAVLHKETLNIKKIFDTIKYPYWKILVFTIIIEIVKFIVFLSTNKQSFDFIIHWYTSAIFLSFIINFYQAKKADTA